MLLIRLLLYIFRGKESGQKILATLLTSLTRLFTFLDYLVRFLTYLARFLTYMAILFPSLARLFTSKFGSQKSGQDFLARFFSKVNNLARVGSDI